MKRLTVIIPFLNEREEVYNTLESIRQTVGDNVYIILINDASSDDFDYQNAARKFDTTYYCHEKRMGVAASRDEAIQICPTEYFLLLDAHMRFFVDRWDELIIRELDKDQRTLLCCQSVAMMRDENGEVIFTPHTLPVFGAYIDFSETSDLLAGWNTYDPAPDQRIVDIPCVLGAGYACTKTYWKYLRGLEGLRSYGMDEQLISIKVWLEGGSCKLLKDLPTGHIYRSAFPYKAENRDLIYNKLYVAQLFMPPQQKKHIFKVVETQHASLYKDVIQEFIRQREWLETSRQYYKQIFCKPIDTYIAYNKEIQSKISATHSI